MNVQRWIVRFLRNRHEDEVDWNAPVQLPEAVCEPLAKSLAVFQLGETGDGGTLRRYAQRTNHWKGFEDYEEALDLFVKEENRHAAVSDPWNTTLQALTKQHLRSANDWNKFWNKNKQKNWDKPLKKTR